MAKKSIPFEEMDSTGMFSYLMDDSADKMAWNKRVALELLQQATSYEDRAERLRHLAATMILEAQEFAAEAADLLAMEFPMSGGDEEPEIDPDE
jgi:hypothetical protein